MEEHGPAWLSRELQARIRDVPDFPMEGIVFKDITPVLADPLLFRLTTRELAQRFGDDRISHVVAIESRGFLFGAPIAQSLGAALVPMRKVGKLPYRTEREEYTLEYGSAALEIHVDAIKAGARILVVDDVLATGGTAAAACRLAERLGGRVVGLAFLLSLAFLRGEEALSGRRIEALLRY